jgi:hypothetical protein
MKTRLQNNATPPESPETRRLKKLQERTIQQQALKDLLKIKHSNGGRLSYGDIKEVIDKYESKGYTCVTRSNLQYRMNLLTERNGLLVSEVQLPFATMDTKDLMKADEVSPLTDDSNNNLENVNNNNQTNMRINKKEMNEKKRNTYSWYKIAFPKLPKILLKNATDDARLDVTNYQENVSRK